ncbi:hypothetical protein OIV83_000963 [Microbotryomycetes sp. JL201]|nr:hypothetical protein OIV83_000963 [Microbotryomycetes sp. JL201]
MAPKMNASPAQGDKTNEQKTAAYLGLAKGQTRLSFGENVDRNPEKLQEALSLAAAAARQVGLNGGTASEIMSSATKGTLVLAKAKIQELAAQNARLATERDQLMASNIALAAQVEALKAEAAYLKAQQYTVKAQQYSGVELTPDTSFESVKAQQDAGWTPREDDDDEDAVSDVVIVEAL